MDKLEAQTYGLYLGGMIGLLIGGMLGVIITNDTRLGVAIIAAMLTWTIGGSVMLYRLN